MSSRRRFLQRSLAAGAGLWLAPEAILADPYRPAAGLRPYGAPVRIRGRVTGDGRALAGVAVSDGYDVTTTDAEGAFELLSSDRQRFVFASVPSGHRIPTADNGIASFYHRIQAGRDGEMRANFAFVSGSDDVNHAFLAVGDTQTQTDFEMDRFHAESIPDMGRTASLLAGRAAFGIAVGDIMFDDLSLFPRYEQGVGRVGIPFFQAVGNHDLDMDAGVDPDSIKTFERRFGPTYYSFDRGEVHYVVLDDVFWHSAGYIGHLDAEQLHWLGRDLDLVEDGRTVVVFLHIPAYSRQHERRGEESPRPNVSLTNRENLYRMLAPFEAHLISGHTHENEHVFQSGVHEHILGTTCGAWWSDQICHDGTPNGYAVYEVAGSEVKWRYKSTDLPRSAQMRLYPAGSDPAMPGELVANIWDWEPGWSVRWFEDGVQRGTLEPRVGMDPLAVARFEGPEAPAHRTWVQPQLTEHLLRADIADASGSITVEAVDRFGRVYTGQLS
ncbi:MAG: hypothetical protein HKN29_04265 [Rhodothermales bacterium]|nr:hypothetical protein [Rhodothermales bacterium]